MGKFAVKEGKSGFVFNLKAGNGEVIATSQVYASEATCMNGVDSVKANCTAEVEDQTVENFETLKHPKYELYQDKAGEFRFRLKAGNAQIIGKSEGYKAKASAKKGIASIAKNAPDAPIVVVEPDEK